MHWEELEHEVTDEGQVAALNQLRRRVGVGCGCCSGQSLGGTDPQTAHTRPLLRPKKREP